MKKLPLGISTFSEIVGEGYAYVDKTKFVHELAEGGKYYLLSRPRRFGKSLFVDTLKEAFEGNREPFRGLWLHDRWDWERKHPVVHVSFGAGVLGSREELEEKVREVLEANQRRLGVSCRFSSSSGRFQELVVEACRKYGRRTVVLVDEYDKPILDNLEEPSRALELRQGLRNLYSVLKDTDACIELVFLTGVSKFSKVSLFSGLNNLDDITLDSRYATLCGYTEPEMLEAFAPRLEGKDLDEIRRWYDGYSWLGERVYNPFSILNYLRKEDFRNYWFETGTPAFLVDLFKKKRYYLPQAECIEASESMIGAFDVDFIEPENLLFQTGYLTIEGRRRAGSKTFYKLRYPNLEVKASLSDYVLNLYSYDNALKERAQLQIYEALREGRPDSLKAVFHALFSSIPADWYRRNKLAAYEGYYASLFYCYFTALGLEVVAEDATSHGRIDMTVKLPPKAYVLEFKVVDIDKTEGSALQQIKDKGYADKYRSRFPEIYLVGLEFDRAERNILRFEWEPAGRTPARG